jgi:hypothetical protein
MIMHVRCSLTDATAISFSRMRRLQDLDSVQDSQEDPFALGSDDAQDDAAQTMSLAASAGASSPSVSSSAVRNFRARMLCAELVAYLLAGADCAMVACGRT